MSLNAGEGAQPGQRKSPDLKDTDLKHTIFQHPSTVLASCCSSKLMVLHLEAVEDEAPNRHRLPFKRMQTKLCESTPLLFSDRILCNACINIRT